MEQDNLEIKETVEVVEVNEETKKQEEYNKLITEELDKRMNEDFEVKKLREELQENELDIIKFRKEVEKQNFKISIRTNNIELLENKLKIKELEKKVALLEELQK